MTRNVNNPSTESARVSREQFSAVHALRGFAALWVVLFHARNAGAFLNPAMGRHGLLASVFFDDGRGGIAIFFVLSGFVIAHSLWRTPMNGGSVAHFMFRRSLRLDPPYWASIALALGVLLLRHGGHGDIAAFTPGVLVAHLFYVQELLRLPEVQPVYWTLTYEIQFYFVYALLLWWVTRAECVEFPAPVRAAPAVLLVIAAFIAAAEPHEWVIHGIFLNYWHAFAAGVLAYRGGFRRDNACLILCILLSIVMLISAPWTAEVFNSPAALTAIGLGLLGRSGNLSGFSGRPFKGLGTISYSLYLTHVPLVIALISLATALFGSSTADSLASYCFVVAGAVVGATVFWWAIERPSHALARRIRMRPNRSAANVDLQPAP